MDVREIHGVPGAVESLLERFTKWFNRMHSRSGTLWEERYKSVIVEDGAAARMMAAYIDLNPVRAGKVADLAEYRWSSYGEAVGGRVKGDSLTRLGAKGNGKKAREGLVRAWFCNEGVGFEAEKWPAVSRLYRRMMGIALGKKPGRAVIQKAGQSMTKTSEKLLDSADNETVLKDLRVAKMLRCRVRYFTDGAVIGSKEFVNEAFASVRERFGAKRKDGARKLKGGGAVASGILWSLRDLQKGIS